MIKSKKGWRRKVITKTTGKKVYLECLDEEYWIIPRKLSIDAMQQIMQYNKIEIDPDDIDADNDDEDKIEEKVKEEIEKMKKKGKTILDADLKEMTKIAFLHGVHDHNFDEPILELDDKGNPKKDDDGDLLAEEDEEGNPKMQKAEWNENLYDQLKGFYEAVMEIYSIVMKFNRNAKKKK